MIAFPPALIAERTKRLGPAVGKFSAAHLRVEDLISMALRLAGLSGNMVPCENVFSAMVVI